MTPAEEERQRQDLQRQFAGNRRLAHQVLFKHRHALNTPAFHYGMIDDFHSPHTRVVVEGFRDSAKSTVAEEAMVVGALMREFKYAIVVGANYERAKERLEVIKNEFDINPYIEELFGKQQGETWGAGKIVTASGVCIQAVGIGMSIRGLRHLDSRPDFALLDDIENEETVKEVSFRDATMRWLYRTFIPALSKHPAARIRFLGNRLDDDAVLVRISRDPAWKHRQYPIMEQTTAADGQERYDLPPGRWRPLWPEKFPLVDIAKMRAEYERLGLLHEFNCEYMCQADDPAARIFHAGYFKNVNTVRTWQAVYAAYDPARTVGQKSAMTGVAVFSWVGSRLVVWRGDARLWLPDEIVGDILNVDSQWGPVEIGVEATGLEEFIMQPLRHAALQRRVLLPVRRLVPPRGKDSFIRGLQPFFKSGEVDFVDVPSDARAQFLSFPTGRKDFPNALAYALMMKPGQPVYSDFGSDHVQPDLLRTQDPFYLILNATSQFTTAVLAQVSSGQARVHADWVREGPPGECIVDLASTARLEAGAAVRPLVPPLRPGLHDVVGLSTALRACQLRERTGGPILTGREHLRSMLTQRRRGEPMILLGGSSRWTLNAFSSGYCYGVDKRGQLSTEPVDGPYRVLMEGLESFAAVLQMGGDDEDERNIRYAYDASGRRYKTILATGESAERELKVP
jgi:hypothetical protein